MARIRTIKPEFPQSESVGRLSREARLCFIQLWTLADDSGRLRGNSRMLASLLYPYDDDAPELIDGWLGELEANDCAVLYRVDGSTYIQICNWLKHQKIDKPTPSRIPEFDEYSRILANSRGGIKDQGSRIKDQGKDHLSPPVGGDSQVVIYNQEPVKTKTTVLTSTKGDDSTKEACRETWGAYSNAYAMRYGVAPVRNKTVNSQVKSFVGRVGMEEAPGIAAFYVTHNAGFYVKKMHPFGILLADAEKVRTEWATGRRMTNTEAKSAEQGDSLREQINRVGAMLGVQA